MGKCKEKVATFLTLPKDVVLGLPILTMIGGGELTLENFLGLCEYNATQIRVSIQDGEMLIEGNSLVIDCYDFQEMKIGGKISTITYQQKGGASC